MTQFNYISFAHHLLNGHEFCNAMNSTVHLVEKYASAIDQDPIVKQALAGISKDTKVMEAKLNNPITLLAPQKLSELDKQQDRDFRNMLTYIKLQCSSRQANKRDAAQHLLAITHSYKKVTTSNYAEQISRVKGYILKFEEKENRAKLTLIGGLDYLANLKESHEAFRLAYLQRMENTGGRSKDKNADLRKTIAKNYATLYRYLLCVYHFNPNTPLKPLVVAFNDVRYNYLIKLNRQEGKAKAKAEKTEKQAKQVSEEEAENQTD